MKANENRITAYKGFKEDFTKKTFYDLQRQMSNLERFMNAYSITLRRVMTEEDFSNLYDMLAKTINKYNN